MENEPSEQLARFTTAFDSLETELKSLMDRPLSVLLAEEERLTGQANVDVTLAYIVYDLIWIYLRTKGIDPMQHSVINELDRVKQYFGKIKRAEEAGQKRPQGYKVDKDAAARFIKHAIASGQAVQAASSTPAPVPAVTPSAPVYEVDTSTRFRHLEDNTATPEKHSDEEVLQILQGSSTAIQVDEEAEARKERKRKKKEAKRAAAEALAQANNTGGTSTPQPATDPEAASPSKKKKKRKHALEEDTPASTSAPPTESDTAEGKKKKRKKRKEAVEEV